MKMKGLGAALVEVADGGGEPAAAAALPLPLRRLCGEQAMSFLSRVYDHWRNELADGSSVMVGVRGLIARIQSTLQAIGRQGGKGKDEGKEDAEAAFKRLVIDLTAAVAACGKPQAPQEKQRTASGRRKS